MDRYNTWVTADRPGDVGCRLDAVRWRTVGLATEYRTDHSTRSGDHVGQFRRRYHLAGVRPKRRLRLPGRRPQVAAARTRAGEIEAGGPTRSQRSQRARRSPRPSRRVDHRAAGGAGGSSTGSERSAGSWPRARAQASAAASSSRSRTRTATVSRPAWRTTRARLCPTTSPRSPGGDRRTGPYRPFSGRASMLWWPPRSGDTRLATRVAPGSHGSPAGEGVEIDPAVKPVLSDQPLVDERARFGYSRPLWISSS